MYAPEVSMTWVRSTLGRNSWMTLEPNSRFMNEFAVIIPTNPAGRSADPWTASWKNRSLNGTASEYCRWQESYSARYTPLSAASFTVMYGGFPTTVV